MDYDADLQGIANLLRKNIEVRNRSLMKRIHLDCFIGSVAVDFILGQSLADTREDAVIMCRKMEEKGIIISVTTANFKDANQYYRFADDDIPGAVLAASSAGNGEGTYFGEGGCKWSFAPHTCHNSYVLDINLAEEVERAVAGASVEARIRAVAKLRARVREQAAPDAPDWVRTQTIAGNDGPMNVYTRKRPRGDFHNVKITGAVCESPVDFIKSVINFDSRKEWETSFEDGVVVEVVDIAEKKNLFTEEVDGAAGAEGGVGVDGVAATPVRMAMELSEAPKPIPNLARSTDDVLTYLSTVDLTGVPEGMSVAFLNDPERQHMLSHLRKQIIHSRPHQCMICDHQFSNAGDARFCPCCATAACANCMSKKVFEIASRQVVVICVHCYRMSSRIWQPPQNVTDSSQVPEEMRGKWWRPEGIADFNPTTGTTHRMLSESKLSDTGDGDGSDDDDVVENGSSASSVNSSNVVPGYKLTHDEDGNEKLEYEVEEVATAASSPDAPDGVRDLRGWSEPPPPPPGEPPRLERDSSSTPSSPGKGTPASTPKALPKTAKCKKCGETISREIEAIEKHMDECTANQMRGLDINQTAADGEMRARAAGTSVVAGSWWSTPKHLAGITRQPDFDKCGARIIYRTARGKGGTRPREACCFQDFFIDPVDGVCYVYEISVRHCDVRGIPGHITEDVLLSMHVASPIQGSPNACTVSIIYQVDERTRSPKWVRSLKSTADAFRADLIREFKACGSLKHIEAKPDATTDDAEGGDGTDAAAAEDDPNQPRMEHFDLMAVLGRGGFGKVMQVRHIATGGIYAMKILKKSELRRRRQVERTKTERTILAAVIHPFVVHLYYAFQSPSKLYMVMDFVQGGDFFTLMRKFKRMPEDWVRIYIAEIALALEHLHKMDLVYRDLKPENILLCEDGHLKITDFGLSRNFEMRPPNPEDIVNDDAVTRSFCGTEQYMSPEMLLQQGHNWRMDWWCLGLLMHEMISTRHPFNGPSHYDTLRNMVTKEPVIDSRLSPKAVAVVRGLLVKDPKARLCCHTGMDELKSLPFFNSLDWEALLARRIRAPYIPELSNKEDVSSFENTFTKEAAVDSIAETPKSMKNGGKSGGGILGFFGFKNTSSQSAAKAGAESAPFDGFEFGRTEDEEVERSRSVTPPLPPLAAVLPPDEV